jgi:hypothetical protein
MVDHMGVIRDRFQGIATANELSESLELLV